MNAAIRQRSTVGIIGLISALYTGLGWMSNLRDALTAQWGQEKDKQPFLRGLAMDLLSLLGLGVAMVVSFASPRSAAACGTRCCGWSASTASAGPRSAVLITLVLTIAANWVVFLWVISRLPRTPVTVRSAVRGALAAAVGFEILKQVATILLQVRDQFDRPRSLFGPMIGLLVFANLVSRFLLYVTAWAATAKENMLPQTVEPPPPAVIRPVVQVQSGAGPARAAGLLGLGALLGLGLRRRR